MKKNRITIFSNGIADYRRYFSLQGNQPTEIGIPVNKTHLGDVIGSINVYGQCQLIQPPTYRPGNDNDTNLEIESDNVLRSLATELTGAEVKVTPHGIDPIEGRIVGLESFEKATGGEAVQVYNLAIMTSKGIRKVTLENIDTLEFTQEQIQSEVDKALRASFEKIRPNSTQISMALQSEKDGAEACVHYTVPAAAWKMSYRLREAGAFYEFQALAHVDNNTEEDWTDAILSVVTGEPITFSTDLAEAKIPNRGHRNIVSAQAADAMGAAPEMASMVQYSSVTSLDANDDVGAQFGNVEVRDVGEFSLWEAHDPVNIPAGSSATIPVFSAKLDKAEGALYFNEANNPYRPFNAIRFTNETENNFGRGVCTTFQDGTFGGSAILQATAPGDEEFIIHAVDTGVRVKRSDDDVESSIVSIKVSNGTALIERSSLHAATWTIDQSTDKTRTLVFDCPKIPNSELAAWAGDGAIEPEKSIPNGVRFELPISQGQTTLQVNQKVTQSQTISLTGNWNWFQTFISDTNQNLAENQSIQAVITAQSGLRDAQTALNKANEDLVRWRQQEESARANLEADDGQLWKDELKNAYTNAKTLSEETIPTLTEGCRSAESAVVEAINSIEIDWKP